MKKVASNICFLVCISLGLIIVTSNAQSSGAEILPPVINLVLDEQPQENQAPVNVVPQSTVDIDIDIDIDATTIIEFSLEVTDPDNNLTSIEVSTTLDALLSPQTLSNDVELSFGNSLNSFIITGTQADLQDAISVLTFIPFLGDTSYTITIVSTDAEGASDEDSFVVNVNGPIDDVPIITFPSF